MSSGSDVAAETGEAIVEATIVSETQAQRIVRDTVVLLFRGTHRRAPDPIYSGTTRGRLSPFRPGHLVRPGIAVGPDAAHGRRVPDLAVASVPKHPEWLGIRRARQPGRTAKVPLRVRRMRLHRGNQPDPRPPVPAPSPLHAGTSPVHIQACPDLHGVRRLSVGRDPREGYPRDRLDARARRGPGAPRSGSRSTQGDACVPATPRRAPACRARSRRCSPGASTRASSSTPRWAPGSRGCPTRC